MASSTNTSTQAVAPKLAAPVIAGLGTALAPHYYSQAEMLTELTTLWAAEHHNPDRLARLHEAVGVAGRYLALPLEEYRELADFGESNRAFIEVGTTLAERALTEALENSGVAAAELDAIFFTSVTGIATPTIDALLVNRMGLKRGIRRIPMFGLGCVAGAAGIARMADYLRAYPDHTAALVSVELCSLTLQRDDLSMANFIASGLFGDGSAAVVGVGAERAARLDVKGPKIVDNRSVFYPDSEWVMGWDVRGTGFKVVLSARLPELVRTELQPDVDQFLVEHDLERKDMARWVCHPGGPAVLRALEDALELDDDALDVTWASLKAIGNLSSSSVLYVLKDTPPAEVGEYGMLLAMGPGFCSEQVLLQW